MFLDDKTPSNQVWEPIQMVQSDLEKGLQELCKVECYFSKNWVLCVCRHENMARINACFNLHDTCKSLLEVFLFYS